MKNIFIIVLISICSFGQLIAQNKIGYVVTTNRDTIFGETKRVVSIFKENGVKVNQAKNYRFDELLYFTVENDFYRVIKQKKKNGELTYFSLCMVIDGKQKLAGDFCNLSEVNYMMYNGFYVSLNHKTFRLQIWPEMLECKEFAKLHAKLTNRELNRIINSERWQELIFIIDKYNKLCS